MKFKERDELVKGLRELADFLDTPAGLSLPKPAWYGTTWVTEYAKDGSWERDEVATKARMVEITKALAKSGKVDKKYTDYSGDAGSFVVSVDFGPMKLGYEVARKTVCTPKIVGIEIKPVMKYVETGETKTENIVEWECLPILAPSD